MSDTHLSFNVNLVCLVLNGDMAGYTLVLFWGVFSEIFGEGSMLLSSPNPNPISD